MADLWTVVNSGPVEAWGSTKNDDRKGELEFGDVIDILDAYPNYENPDWLQFELVEGGVYLDSHSESPYSEYWVKRDEVTLARTAGEPTEDPADSEPEISDAELGAAVRTVIDAFWR